MLITGKVQVRSVLSMGKVHMRRRCDRYGRLCKVLP